MAVPAPVIHTMMIKELLEENGNIFAIGAFVQYLKMDQELKSIFDEASPPGAGETQPTSQYVKSRTFDYRFNDCVPSAKQLAVRRFEEIDEEGIDEEGFHYCRSNYLVKLPLRIDELYNRFPFRLFVAHGLVELTTDAKIVFLEPESARAHADGTESASTSRKTSSATAQQATPPPTAAASIQHNPLSRAVPEGPLLPPPAPVESPAAGPAATCTVKSCKSRRVRPDLLLNVRDARHCVNIRSDDEEVLDSMRSFSFVIVEPTIEYEAIESKFKPPEGSKEPLVADYTPRFRVYFYLYQPARTKFIKLIVPTMLVAALTVLNVLVNKKDPDIYLTGAFTIALTAVFTLADLAPPSNHAKSFSINDLYIIVLFLSLMLTSIPKRTARYVQYAGIYMLLISFIFPFCSFIGFVVIWCRINKFNDALNMPANCRRARRLVRSDPHFETGERYKPWDTKNPDHWISTNDLMGDTKDIRKVSIEANPIVNSTRQSGMSWCRRPKRDSNADLGKGTSENTQSRGDTHPSPEGSEAALLDSGALLEEKGDGANPNQGRHSEADTAVRGNDDAQSIQADQTQDDATQHHSGGVDTPQTSEAGQSDRSSQADQMRDNEMQHNSGGVDTLQTAEAGQSEANYPAQWMRAEGHKDKKLFIVGVHPETVKKAAGSGLLSALCFNYLGFFFFSPKRKRRTWAYWIFG
mmetsp:Transcript_6139/g.18535  ORF Transcript_6139/g.18535 Transcript_6139/m.18535 type:complete len:694 (+) Transcript_6139:80-2161(+)